MNKIRANARPGFTLIELLIVIAIIGVLAALSAGAYFRIADGQRASATEATLSKLNTGLDRRWRAVIDQAAKDARENKIPIASYELCRRQRGSCPDDLDIHAAEK